MKIDWEHIYLLGWHSKDGKRNLTSWRGKYRWIDVVVVGATDNDLKHLMWASPLHKDFQLILIPPLTNCQWFANMNNGLHAFGAYVEDGIKRPPMRELTDEWDWFKRIKGTK